MILLEEPMYQMNEQTADLLDRVRGKLETDLHEDEHDEDLHEDEDLEDEVTEDEGDESSYQFDENTLGLLDQVRRKLEIDLHEVIAGGTTVGADAKAGVGGAKNNPTDVADAFDMYLDNILDAVMEHAGLAENAAQNFIMKQADDLADSGDLPPWPTDGSDDEVSIWLGKAKTLGFHRYCVKQAQG
jgi:hypothetical protein